MNRTTLCIAAMASFVAASCANRVAPSGGAKDVTPPQVVASTPPNHSTGMNGSEVQIEFDEYIRLKDIQKQLIVSPVIDPAPEITVHKKTLVIRFEKPLSPQTTYSLQFGSSVADIHEGNTMDTLRYVFSTGSYLDSLSVAGRVVRADNHEPAKGVLVMLYPPGDDSALVKHLPGFFARTDDAGLFRIDYLAAGSFRIHALADGNGNYIMDQPDEDIAFADRLVSTADSLPVELGLFRQPVRVLRLTHAAMEEPGKLRAVFNVPFRTVTAALADSTQPWTFGETGIRGDTLILWVPDTTADSLQVIFRENGIPFDTALFTLPRRGGKGSSWSHATTLQAPVNGLLLDPGTDLVFTASRPLAGIDTARIALTVDSQAVALPPLIPVDSARRRIRFDRLWSEDSTYRITFLPGALHDITGRRNDTLAFMFRLRPAADFGTLRIHLAAGTPPTPFLVQLTNGDKVVRERSGATGDLDLPFLPPGSYRARIVIDENGNGRWDTGDLFRKKQPERMIYYGDAITIRANWDLEVDWDAAEDLRMLSPPPSGIE